MATEHELADHLRELRRYAAEGRATPLLGGELYILWGAALLVASALHATLVLTGGTALLVSAVWGTTVAVTALGTGLAVQRLAGNNHASADRNVMSGFAWIVAGAACLLFFGTAMLTRPDVVELTPVVTGFVFAVTSAFTTMIARLPMFRWVSLGWLAFGTAYLATSEIIGHMLLIALAAVGLLIVPGFMLRGRRRTTAAG